VLLAGEGERSGGPGRGIVSEAETSIFKHGMHNIRPCRTLTYKAMRTGGRICIEDMHEVP
jgi:hypothetical protein